VRIERLRLESFKRFRAPLVLEGLAPGLNLFAAPNESGKSTVAEAIRAAFFERHRSSAVEHLRPWGEGSATPLVELQFELGGQRGRLLKAFLGKKRCELQLGALQLDGAAAEDHLAQLLGFKFPGKGASSAEHMGIPGLLWIRQGRSQQIADEVLHARDHLRAALGESMGELATSSGDAVLRRIEAERNELLTPAGGAPRGAYAEARRLQEQLVAERDRLAADITAYRHAVDRLAELRQVQARDETDRPWEAARQRLGEAQARLEAAQGLEARRQLEQAALAQWSAQARALREPLQVLAAQEEAVQRRDQQRQAAQAAWQAAQAELAAWEPRQQRATEADAQARDTLGRVQRQAALAAQRSRLAALQSQQLATEQQLQQAGEAQGRWRQLQAEADALALPAAGLKLLRSAEQALRDARTRLDSVATTLQFSLLPGQAVLVDGDVVQGSAQRTVAARTQVDIEGVGRIGIVPGGAELETRAAECRHREQALADALQRLGVASVPAAEERARLQAQRAAEAEAARSVLAALAPQGLAVLEAALATLKLQTAEATIGSEHAADLAQAGSLLNPGEAAAAEVAARRALQAATEGLNAARLQLANTSAQRQAAEAEFNAARALVEAPGRPERKAQAQTEWVQAQAQEAAAQQRLVDLQQQLAAVRPALLQQDVARLTASVQQLEAEQARRAEQITRLEVELETKGALGLEEAAAQQQRALEQARRRVAELQRRAAALDHLLGLLREKRALLARRLQAPLQKHLNHYLQILFPGAAIEVGEDLAPGRLTRTGQASGATEGGGFEDMSVGTREQLGIVARLAYADLLREAGKPTLLILDDALVHSDDERLGQMKRVLYDAATRHQILVFTCHPAAWRDLGVAARPLG
jgi:hypothetical protein